MKSLTEKSREIQVSLIINLIAIMVVFFMLTFEVIYFIKGVCTVCGLLLNWANSNAYGMKKIGK